MEQFTSVLTVTNLEGGGENGNIAISGIYKTDISRNHVASLQSNAATLLTCVQKLTDEKHLQFTTLRPDSIQPQKFALLVDKWNRKVH